MKIKFKCPLGKSELKISRRAFRAGEIALGRPADLDKRIAPKSSEEQKK
jgi:hypothetical protein